jgi:hypothetical protein
MKTFILGICMLVSCSVTFADAGLDAAVKKAANSVNIEQVAQAVLCAETLNSTHCSFVHFGVSGTKYSNAISILTAASYATEVYSAEELKRIAAAIEILKSNDSKPRSKSSLTW